MRLSELISSLEDLGDKYGDLDVMIYCNMGTSFPWIPMHMDCVNVVAATEDADAVAYVKGSFKWVK